jgi:hypothetical protein
MKKWLVRTSLLFLVVSHASFLHGQNNKKCCDDAGCKATAIRYAIKLTGLVEYLPKYTSDPVLAKKALDSLKQSNSAVYNDFMKTAKEAHSYFYGPNAKFRNDGCFTEAMPTENKSNVQLWVTYVGNLGTTPKFPSAEFCSGLKFRIELGQGATDMGKKTTGYLGSLRGYLVYTVGKKDECGNHVRIMAGPAFFLRGSTSYAALSSRIAIRLMDIKPAVFPLGDINLFGEYNTSFGNLSYAGIGAEVELGILGFNISGNNNMKTGRKGFSVNVFYRF